MRATYPVIPLSFVYNINVGQAVAQLAEALR